jgi:hypothetical protein
LVKTLARIIAALSLAAIAFAHLYDLMLTIMENQFRREMARKPDIPLDKERGVW